MINRRKYAAKGTILRGHLLFTNVTYAYKQNTRTWDSANADGYLQVAAQLFQKKSAFIEFDFSWQYTLIVIFGIGSMWCASESRD